LSAWHLRRASLEHGATGENALLIVDADSEADVRARLAEDPWADDMLTIESVRL
jgi:hypothetical protein